MVYQCQTLVSGPDSLYGRYYWHVVFEQERKSELVPPNGLE